jgi:hypothetical protein
LAGGAVAIAPVSGPFPANREFCREIIETLAFGNLRDADCGQSQGAFC